MKVPAFSRGFWWLLGACGLFFIAGIIRISLLHHAFALDDFKIIVANDFISHAKNALILFDPRYLFHPYPLICGARPLTVFSFMIDYRLWGSNPFGYHLANIVIHAFNTVLVYGVAGLCAARFAPDHTHAQRWFLAMVAGLVFCVHPLQTEAVAIASFRGDLLATFFSLSAVGCFLAGLTVSSRSGVRAGFAGAAGCLVLGLLSKETAVTIPAVMALAAFLDRGRAPSRAIAVFTAACAVLATAYLLIFWRLRVEYPLSLSVFPSLVGTPTPLHSVAAYVNIAVNAWIHHWSTIIVPQRLSVDYQMLVPSALQVGRCLVAGAIVIGLLGTAWYTRSKLWGFGIGMFVITYLPVSNIIPLTNTMNDRYLYLPMAGIALGAAALAARLYALRPYAGIAAAAGLIGWYGAATLIRQPVFATDYALYAEAVRRSPDNIRVRYNRGISSMVRGDFTTALAELSLVRRMNPLYKRDAVQQSMIDCYRELGAAPPAGGVD